MVVVFMFPIIVIAILKYLIPHLLRIGQTHKVVQFGWEKARFQNMLVMKSVETLLPLVVVFIAIRLELLFQEIRSEEIVHKIRFVTNVVDATANNLIKIV